MFWSNFARNDMETYRLGYPKNVDHPHWNQNLSFYKNEVPLMPEGVKIDDVHKDWAGRYNHLEMCHSYIQWLFPIQEQGLNHMAHPLQKHEIATMRSDPVVMRRVVMSYRMMLDFWGMDLLDEPSGKLGRCKNWESQFRNLNRSMHNYLRITRMLKFLGEMGLEHYKLPFLSYFEEEIYKTEELENCRDSFEDYWVATIIDDTTRVDYLAHLKTYPKKRVVSWWERREMEEKKDKERLLRKDQQEGEVGSGNNVAVEGDHKPHQHPHQNQHEAEGEGHESQIKMKQKAKEDVASPEQQSQEQDDGKTAAAATTTETATATAAAAATAAAQRGQEEEKEQKEEGNHNKDDNAGRKGDGDDAANSNTAAGEPE